MNPDAPITWLIGEINNIVSTGANATASAIATAVTPIAAACFGIYIILITVNYLRGAESEPVIDFGLRCAGFAVVIGMGINAANYANYIMPIVTNLGADLGSAVSGGTASSSTLDELAKHYLKIMDEGFTTANAGTPPFNFGPLLLYFVKCVIIGAGLIPFLCAATLCLIVANVGSTIVAMVGPIYFCFLLFPATRQYFSAWVNTAFSYALIPLIVAVIATISIGISKAMLSSGAGGTVDLSEVALSSVFLAALGNVVLLFLLKQVSSMASSLSAGGINAGMTNSGAVASSAVAGGKGVYRGYKALRSGGTEKAGGSMSNRSAG